MRGNQACVRNPFGSGHTFLLREIAAVPIDTKSRHHFDVVESLR